MPSIRCKPGRHATPYGENPSILVFHELITELAKEEAEHHDHEHEDPAEQHQLNSWRNVFYHRGIQRLIKKATVQLPLLEIGAGSGQEAEALAHEYSLVLTDVSPGTLDRLEKKMSEHYPQADIAYIACDGEHLPFEDYQFGGVYMCATFHHFAHPARALSECHQMLTNGGVLVLGIEPNWLYFAPIRTFRQVLYRMTHTDPDHISRADAEMSGFSHGQLVMLFSDGRWSDIKIQPMWLFAGCVHYILEFIHRAFRMKKRIVLPLWLEMFVVGLDEALFHLPGVTYLCWHWIVSAKKIDA